MGTPFEDSFEHGWATLIEQHGVPAVYHPTDGPDREITVLVDRSPPAVLDQAGNVVTFQAVVRALDDGTYGIRSREINKGGDRISITARGNMDSYIAKTSMLVYDILNDEGGVVDIAVR